MHVIYSLATQADDTIYGEPGQDSLDGGMNGKSKAPTIITDDDFDNEQILFLLFFSWQMTCSSAERASMPFHVRPPHTNKYADPLSAVLRVVFAFFSSSSSCCRVFLRMRSWTWGEHHPV